MVARAEWGATYKVKHWETIKSELPVKYMLSNQFILVWEEVEHLERDYVSTSERASADMERTQNEFDAYCETAEKEMAEKEDALDSAKKLHNKTSKLKTKEYVAKLTELASNDDKDVFKRAKDLLRGLEDSDTAKKKAESEAKKATEEKAKVEAEEKAKKAEELKKAAEQNKAN